MERIEAARILHPDTTRAALAPYAYDPSRKVKILTAVELLGGDVSKLDTGSQATDLLEQSTEVDDGKGD